MDSWSTYVVVKLAMESAVDDNVYQGYVGSNLIILSVTDIISLHGADDLTTR